MWYNDIRFVGCYQVLVKKKVRTRKKNLPWFRDIHLSFSCWFHFIWNIIDSITKSRLTCFIYNWSCVLGSVSSTKARVLCIVSPTYRSFLLDIVSTRPRVLDPTKIIYFYPHWPEVKYELHDRDRINFETELERLHFVKLRPCTVRFLIWLFVKN